MCCSADYRVDAAGTHYPGAYANYGAGLAPNYYPNGGYYPNGYYPNQPANPYNAGFEAGVQAGHYHYGYGRGYPYYTDLHMSPNAPIGTFTASATGGARATAARHLAYSKLNDVVRYERRQAKALKRLRATQRRCGCRWVAWLH